MSKPFSQACENNKAAILAVISQYFQGDLTVLEIGSYTGQHAQYFASQLAQVTWQPSDIQDNLPIVEAGLADLTLSNILPPLVLDVSQQPWPVKKQAVFSVLILCILWRRKSWQIFFTGQAWSCNPAAFFVFMAHSNTRASTPVKAMPASNCGCRSVIQ